MRRRRAFTIIELLVVIGILAILLGILLPVLTRLRGAAMKVVCSARLRDLTMASTMYQGDHRVYPAPMQDLVSPSASPPTYRPAPQRIDDDLLNDIRPYLRFPEVAPTTPVASLPAFVQCPFIEGSEFDRGPFAGGPNLAPGYYTGYSYFGRIDEISVDAPTSPSPSAPPPPLLPLLIPLKNLPIVGGLVPVLEPGVELKPGRAAGAKSPKRAVLWADNVSQLDGSGNAWQFTHARGATHGSANLVYTSPADLLGQHRGFSDGSVEWVEAGSPDLRVDVPQTSTSTTASFKTFLGELWWF